MKKTILLAALMLLVSIGAFSVRKAFVIGMPGQPDAPIADWEQNTRMVEEGFRYGGYLTQAVYDPGFAYTFPDLDRFLDGVASGDTVVVYFSGYFAEKYSSLFLLPSDYDPGKASPPLDSYNIQRLLNRLARHDGQVVLFLDLYPQDIRIDFGHWYEPTLILHSNRQLVMAGVHRPDHPDTAKWSGIFPGFVANKVHYGRALIDEDLHQMTPFIDSAADESIRCWVQNHEEIMWGLGDGGDNGMPRFEIMIPGYLDKSVPSPGESGDGGGSYSF